MGDITAGAMFVVISLMMLVAACLLIRWAIDDAKARGKSPILVAACLLIRWAIDDAKARGKSPILVAAAVILFFPWGWIAWLLFRPENYVDGGRKPFRLDDHRVQ